MQARTAPESAKLSVHGGFGASRPCQVTWNGRSTVANTGQSWFPLGPWFASSHTGRIRRDVQGWSQLTRPGDMSLVWMLPGRFDLTSQPPTKHSRFPDLAKA